MKSKPSPALVVSIVALIVAMGGTAIAATIITSSSQIKNRTIRGVDLRNGTISKKQLSASVVKAIDAGAPAPGAAETQALETHRQTGPDMPKGGSALVAELAMPPGTYAVFAKTTITPFSTDDGLLDTLTKDNTLAAECTLDVNGTGDFAISPIAGPGTTNPATLNTQLTRTIDVPGKATLTCKVDTIRWQAANSSIIALKVGATSRTETP